MIFQQRNKSSKQAREAERKRHMKRKQTGYAVLEFNHSGIPDSELQPEQFDDRQRAVLQALAPDRRAAIERGCPATVIDLTTGEGIASFNMKNVKPSEFEQRQLGRALYESMQRALQDPETKRKFEEWKKQRGTDGSQGKK